MCSGTVVARGVEAKIHFANDSTIEMAMRFSSLANLVVPVVRHRPVGRQTRVARIAGSWVEHWAAQIVVAQVAEVPGFVVAIERWVVDRPVRTTVGYWGRDKVVLIELCSENKETVVDWC